MKSASSHQPTFSALKQTWWLAKPSSTLSTRRTLTRCVRHRMCSPTARRPSPRNPTARSANGPRFTHAPPDGTGTPDAADGTRERRFVTIVAVELSVSMPDIDPEDYETLIGPYRGRVERVLDDAGGELLATTGGEVLALFGAPTAWGNDPARAVRAAVAVIEECTSHDGFPPDKPVEVRIGIDSGDVLVDLSGSGGLLGTPTGDLARRATQLRSAAQPGAVLVGTAAREATHGTFDYRPGPLAGSSESWFVAPWTSDAPDSFPVVGRSDELALIDMLWRRIAAERHPHLVTLLGPPGIGKTRLAREVASVRVAEQAATFTGRSLPRVSTVGYGPFREQFQMASGILDSDDRTVRTEKLAAWTASLLPGDDAIGVTEHLQGLLGLGDEVTGDRQLLFHAVRRARKLSAPADPSCWCSTTSTGPTRAPSTSSSGSQAEPATRRSCSSHWAAPSWSTDDRPGAEAKARQPPSTSKGYSRQRRQISFMPRLGEHPARAALTDVVVEAADGNPLFLEELAASAATMDSGRARCPPR